jgi:hypothetical protein
VKRALTLTVEQLLASHTPPERTIVVRLRGLVKAAVPEAGERVYPGWHAIGYTHPEAGYFGGIFPRSGVVRLCFEWGAHLPDPHGILTGDQKRIRYVDVYDESDIPHDAIADMLRSALAYQLAR